MLSDGDFQYIPYLFISMLANLDRYKIVLASNSPRRKELMTGLGVDGSRDEMKLDFGQVRGDFESNPFVTAVLKHIDDKTALGEELINRIGQLA